MKYLLHTIYNFLELLLMGVNVLPCARSLNMCVIGVVKKKQQYIFQEQT